MIAGLWELVFPSGITPSPSLRCAVYSPTTTPGVESRMGTLSLIWADTLRVATMIIMFRTYTTYVAKLSSHCLGDPKFING